jgi:hypothetical protein
MIDPPPIRVRTAAIVDVARDVVWRAMVVALVVLGLDCLSTWVLFGDGPSSLRFLQVPASVSAALTNPLDQVTPDIRHRLIGVLLSLFGFAPAIVIALTSFAVSGLSQYGNPSFLLLYRWRGRELWAKLLGGLVAGRSNPLHRSLVLSLALVGSLLLISGTFAAGLTRNHSLALTAVVVLAALLVFNLLWLLVWILTLRRPRDSIVMMLSMGLDVFAYVKSRQQKPLEPIKATCLSGSCSRFVEQEEIRNCLQGLTEFVLRSLEQRQRIAALDATEVLGALALQAEGGSFPASWQVLGDPDHDGQQKDDWLLGEFAKSFESIAVECADLHYSSVGTEAVQRLGSMGEYLARGHSAGRLRNCRIVLSALMSTCDQCVVSGDFDVRDVSLQQIGAIIGGLESTDAVVQDDFLRDLATGCAIRAVQLDDIASVRSVLRCIVGTSPEATPHVDALMAAVLSLGASALAARKYGCATALIDHVALKGGWGTSLLRIAETRFANQDALTKLKYVPAYVTWDYGLIFGLVVAARARVLSSTPWSSAWQPRLAILLKEVSNPNHWATVTVKRMALAASYPRDDIDPWVAAVDWFVPRETRVDGENLFVGQRPAARIADVLALCAALKDDPALLSSMPAINVGLDWLQNFFQRRVEVAFDPSMGPALAEARSRMQADDPLFLAIAEAEVMARLLGSDDGKALHEPWKHLSAELPSNVLLAIIAGLNTD